ncbi:MAG: hypothetical protein LBQ20_07175 [Rhodanobacter sp.]|jgi:predicted nucleic-acid-binding protein|nr:hypothetical protein [Rhodanobacter sp.]
MAYAIGRILNLIKKEKINLPVRGFDINAIEKIVNTLGDFDEYLLSVIVKQEAPGIAGEDGPV